MSISMSIDQSSKSNNYYIIRGSMLNYIRSYTVRKGNTKKGLLIGVLILSCTLMYYVFGYLDIFSFLSKEQSVNYRNTLNMAIDGNEFWIEKDKERGYQHVDSDKDVKLLSDNSTVHHSTCKDFFVIWPGDCIESHDYLDERIRTLSAQMIVMNSTLNFFTTDVKGCIWDVYSKVKVVLFNATQELELQGFQSVLGIIDRWDKTRFTRLSDILRLCLAYRHQMSYLDTDVHLLELKKSWYESEYVGAQMWSDSKNAIELTNAAFCISRNILKDMLEYQKKIVIRKKGGKKEKYFYTELGPSMFHHVLFNRRAVALYSQNNPAEPSLDRIAKDIHLFAHKQLHLTGRIRKGNKDLKFDELVNVIRKKSGLPELDIVTSAKEI